MKISEYIQKLEELKAAEGDVEVYTQTYSGCRVAQPPKAASLRLLSKRESVQRTWQSWDAADIKGPRVATI